MATSETHTIDNWLKLRGFTNPIQAVRIMKEGGIYKRGQLTSSQMDDKVADYMALLMSEEGITYVRI